MVAAAAAAALTVCALAQPASAFTPAPASASAAASGRHHALQQDLNALVRADGVPAALAAVKDRHGRTRHFTAGVADLATGAKVPRDGQVRIGSNTKVFTATVLLQLVGEGKISLDKYVDDYLPGIVRGDGIDGSQIKIRQLLQHTSGLPSYVDALGDQVRTYQPRELLDLALKQKNHFKPGEDWEYNNTNYVLAGLIIEEVTRRPLAQEMDRRIIKRIGLRHTYFPAPGETALREAHPHGYYQETDGAPLRDGTELDPSWGWAAGQMVSTNSDLNRFYTALLQGRLLKPGQLAQMKNTRDLPQNHPFAQNAQYGLGLVKTPLSCGGVYWGHGGSIPGYETRGGVTTNGTAVNIAVTMQPGKATKKHLEQAVDRAFCHQLRRQ